MNTAAAGALVSNGVESVQFLNELLAHLWPYINVAVSTTIKDVVEPMFETMLPSIFKKTTFRKIDLGTHPIQFDRVDVQTRTKDSIKLDLDVNWNGRSDIELDVPILGCVGVESIKIRGRLSMIMQPLVPVMPVIGAVQAGFINPPHVDIDFTGLADIADSVLLRGSIRKIINKVIADIFVLPNRFLIKLNPANDYFATYILPIGYLRLTLESGSGFKTTGKFIKDVPDVYCQISLGAEEVVRSKTKNNSNDPVWNQKFDFLLADYEQNIKIRAWDDDIAGDDDLGTGTLCVKELLAAGKKKQVPIYVDGKDTGSKVTVSCQVLEFSNSKTNFDLAITGKHTKSGMLSIVVAGASCIPEEPGLTPSCKVTFGEEEFCTPAVMECPGMDPRMPSFDSTFRVPLTVEMMKAAPSIKFELMNKKRKMGEGVVHFGDVLDAAEMKLRKNFTMENGAVLKTCVVLSSLGTDS